MLEEFSNKVVSESTGKWGMVNTRINSKIDQLEGNVTDRLGKVETEMQILRERLLKVNELLALICYNNQRSNSGKEPLEQSETLEEAGGLESHKKEPRRNEFKLRDR